MDQSNSTLPKMSVSRRLVTLVILPILFFGVANLLLPSTNVAEASLLAPGWSAPVQTVPIYGNPTSVSCTGTSFCLVADSSSNTFVYNGNSFSSFVRIDPNQRISSVSCISATNCFLVDDAGNLLTFNGSSFSKALSIDPSNSIVSISCTSALCVAVDQAGNALLYQQGTWTAPKLLENPANAIIGVSCVSSFCAIVDGAGNAFEYSNGAYSGPYAAGVSGATSISCLSQQNCFITTIAGQVEQFLNNSFIAPSVIDSQGNLTSISCEGSNCVAVDNAGNAYLYSGPGWSQIADNLSGTSFVSCGTATFCLAVSSSGSYSSFSGGVFSSAGMLEITNNSLEAVSCLSAVDCMAVSNGGQLIVFNGSSFLPPANLGLGPLVGISCASSYCGALSKSGTVEVLSSSGSVVNSLVVDPNASPQAISCTPNFYNCFIVDSNGSVINEVSAAGVPQPSSSYTVASYPTGGLTSISCPTTSSCYLVDSHGDYASCSFNGTSWSCSTLSGIDSQASLNDISCVYTTSLLCVATDNSGNYLTYAGSSWSAPSNISSAALAGVSCYSPSNCIIVDDAGSSYLLASPNSIMPLGVADPQPSIVSSISCPAPSFCLAVDLSGQAVTYSAIAPGVFYGIRPVRIVDTRQGATDPSTYAGKALGPGGTLSFNVVNANNDTVPSNASAVVLNVTAVGPTQAGYLSVYPTGDTQPNVSSVNFSAYENAVANFVEVPIGQNNEVSVFNAFGTTNILVDVEGYVAPPQSNSGYFIPLSSPVRIADTRSGSIYQGSGQPVTPTNSLTINVEGVSGIPASGVEAVVANITATGGTTSGGYLQAYPAGSALPSASTVNFNANQTVPNLAIVTLSSSGEMTVSYGPSGSCNVIVDIFGYFTNQSSNQTGYEFHPVTPARIFDTRSGSVYQGANLHLMSGTPVSVQVEGYGGIPKSNVAAIVANATVTNTTANNGYLTVYPQGQSQPNTSNLNWSQGETVANSVVVGLSTTGGLNAVSEISNCDLIIDVFGYYGS